MASRFTNVKTHVLEKTSFRILLLVATLVLGMLYIWQVNVAATSGYAMRELESSIHDLELEQERLELQVADLQSVDSVSQRVQMLGLTKVSTVHYFTPGAPTVAINR